MNKIAIIIRREYLALVKKKSFIVVTLLGPIGILLMLFLPTIIMFFSTASMNNIAVIDHTGRYAQTLQNTESATFETLAADTPEDSVKKSYQADGYDAFIVIAGSPAEADNVKLYSESSLPPEIIGNIKGDLREALRREYIGGYEAHNAGLDSLFALVDATEAHVNTIKISPNGEETENSVDAAIIISMILAFLIYGFILSYGSVVMSAVTEEKTSRIIELLVSSVKPFQLLMGKIVGVALVVITQLAIWAIFAALVVSTAYQLTGALVPAEKVDVVSGILASINMAELLPAFLFYGIFGYLLYAGLFAAVGAACDNPSEGQQFALPMMVPLFIALYMAISVFSDPQGGVAVWGSIIPFTSPIVMLARLPFGVPAWQIIVSVVLLIATFILCTWVAARIYRVGILMYGKKTTFKELTKWFKQRV